MGDLALFSILKIIAKINSLSTLRRYKKDSRMIDKVKDYKVSVGFGLHYGWAIEGPIGSEFKVDLSYLSPNVNLSSRLCAATL
jgi:class 3 adenylate cyclase